VEIEFDTGKLEKTLNSEALIRREYGEQAGKIMTRLGVLRSAANLSLVPEHKPERRHELSGGWSGCFAVDLKHPFRLIFRPAQDPVPRKGDGGIDLIQVTAIRIMAIEDYH